MTDPELETCAVCGAVLDEEGNCDNPACDTNADEIDLEVDDEEEDDIEIIWPGEDIDDEEESVT